MPYENTTTNHTSNIKYVVHLKPFKVEAYLNGQLLVTVNERSLLNMEFERNAREHFRGNCSIGVCNKVQVDSTYKFSFDISPQDEFTEMFDGKVEKAQMGPRAISLDFEFPHRVDLSGIPERTSTKGGIGLDDTLRIERNDIEVLSDPYRLFNLDVFEYQANDTYLGLYGSVPYLASYSPSHQGCVGLYWLNAAETWVDIYTSKKPHREQRGAIWSSETNVLEFAIMLASSPKELIQKFTSVSGRAGLPPYFAIGFH